MKEMLHLQFQDKEGRRTYYESQNVIAEGEYILNFFKNANGENYESFWTFKDGRVLRVHTPIKKLLMYRESVEDEFACFNENEYDTYSALSAIYNQEDSKLDAVLNKIQNISLN